MNSIYLTLLCVLTALSSCQEKPIPPDPPAPFTRYNKDIVLQSTILDASIKYSVYLPENYVSDSTSRYDVVYLLHGYGDDNNSWNDEWMRVSSIINYLESEGSIEPMIYVMPQGFNTYYVNRYNGQYNYMDMFASELVPAIDKTLRTKPDREHRAVIGYSMGGYGALILPSKHPELFSVSVPLSMSYRTDPQYISEPSSGWDNQWGSIFGGRGQVGRARLTDYYKLHNPFYYFTPETADSYSNIKFFLSCGDDEEQLLIANDTLHVQMRSLGIYHEFRVKDGAHTSDYWRDATSEALPFIQDCFNGKNYRKEETVTIDTKELESKTIAAGNMNATIYFPSGYDAGTASNALYFLYEEPEEGFLKQAVSSLADVVNSSKCILIGCNAAEMAEKGISLQTIAAAAEKEFTPSGNNVGIGCLRGGKILYDATLSGEPALKAAFMIEASIGREIENPAENILYYFTLSDESPYYAGADALYQKCKRGGRNYQYRVYNGIKSSNSILFAINNMILPIKEQTK